MGFFEIMMVIAVLGFFALMYLWFYSDRKKGKPINLYYSEVIGESIYEHPTPYKAVYSNRGNYMYIKALQLTLPCPDNEWMVPNIAGGKNIHLIKFGNNRYGYRIPCLSNKIAVPKVDDDGKILRDKKGKPILTSFKWKLADNVIEPETVDWSLNEIHKSDSRHKKKKGLLESFLPYFGIIFVFIFAVMMFNQGVGMMKEFIQVYREEKIDALQEQAKAEDSATKLDNLLSKVSGQRLLGTEEEESQRAIYNNQTK